MPPVSCLAPPLHVVRRNMPPLREGQLQIWRIAAEQPRETMRRWYGMLDAVERARLARFRQDADRNRGLVSRGALRELLGIFLHQQPDSVRFASSAQGKPRVVVRDARPRVEFNISHSGDWVFAGFALDQPVGIDVERWGAVPDASLLSGYFGPEELAEWSTIAPEDQLAAFFAGWTRKESYLKALGSGLHKGLHSFRMNIAPDARPRLLCDDDDPEAPSRWRFANVETEARYSATVGFGGPDLQIAVFDWD